MKNNKTPLNMIKNNKQNDKYFNNYKENVNNLLRITSVLSNNYKIIKNINFAGKDSIKTQKIRPKIWFKS